MPTMEAVIEDIDKLDRQQQIGVLDKLNSRLFREWPGLERRPQVCGGSIRIRGTRIPVWSLAAYRKLGVSDARILENFPTLSQEDLVIAWAYADTHPEEINAEIADNENA